MELPAWRKLGANLNLADAGGYFKTIFKNSSCPTFSSPRDLIFCAMTALITFHLNHFIPTQSFFLCSKILEILAGKLGSHKTKTKSRLNARSTMTEILGVTLTDTTQSGKERWLLQPARKGARLVECTRRRHGHSSTRPGSAAVTTKGHGCIEIDLLSQVLKSLQASVHSEQRRLI